MSFSNLWNAIHEPLYYAALASLKIALSALAIGLVLGLLVALARMSGNRHLARGAVIYIEFLRGLPALILLLLIYFGLATIGIRFTSLQAAILGLGLNASAYLAEVFRAGLEGVPKGQIEAARAIGMRRAQVLRWVVLPQALRISLPPIGNVAISLIKDTSVASLIAAPDLMLRAQDLSSQYFQPLEIYLVVGAFYFAICFPLSLVVRAMERRSERSS